MEQILKPYIGSTINIDDVDNIKQIKLLIRDFTLFKDISKYFPNIENESINNILTNLIFHKYLEDQIILKKGDKINGIYIIFSGELSVYNYEKDKDDTRKPDKKYIKRKNIFNGIHDINLLPNSILNPGDAIGYIPNYSEDNFSRKLIQATKETILGYINYSHFNSIIKEMKIQDTGQILPFIKSLNLFPNKNNLVEKLNLYITQKRYNKNSFIFQEGNKYQTFYIIKNGIVNISVKIKKTTKALIEPELLIGNVNKIKITGSKKNELKGFYTENLDYNLIKFCKGEIIGDIEYYKKYPFYLYSAKCITKVDLLEINLKKFIALATKSGDNLFKFHKQIKEKIDFFKKRIQSINSTIKKVNIDTQKRDLYTKMFLDNNIHKNVEENEKYINCGKNPLGKSLQKYKPFKMNKNLSNIIPNYLSVLKITNKCLSAKVSKNKRKNKFLFQTYFDKMKALNSRNKIFEKINFKKLDNFVINKVKIRRESNNSLIKMTDKISKISDNSKHRLSKLENYEFQKVSNNMKELSGLDESKKNDFINVFVGNYKNEHEERDKTFFNKKLKHNFLIENRRTSISKTFKDSSKSIFHLTNPFKPNDLNYNHIY